MKDFKEVLNEMKKNQFDFLTFLDSDKEGQIAIMASDYSNRGEDIGGNSMGKEYHIVLFRDHKTNSDKYDELDYFDAVLVDPLEYVSGLIPAGFYGVIGRKTTTSGKIIDKLVAKFRDLNYN